MCYRGTEIGGKLLLLWGQLQVRGGMGAGSQKMTGSSPAEEGEIHPPAKGNSICKA